MRSREVADRGEVVIGTAAPMRELKHLARLLEERLAKVQLLAPAGELEMEALDVQALEERSESLIPDTVRAGESLGLVLERIAARLGPERVLRPSLVEDHRLEWMQQWKPAPEALPRRRTRTTAVPQPTFVFPEPLRLTNTPLAGVRGIALVARTLRRPKPASPRPDRSDRRATRTSRGSWLSRTERRRPRALVRRVRAAQCRHGAAPIRPWRVQARLGFGRLAAASLRACEVDLLC